MLAPYLLISLPLDGWDAEGWRVVLGIAVESGKDGAPTERLAGWQGGYLLGRGWKDTSTAYRRKREDVALRRKRCEVGVRRLEPLTIGFIIGSLNYGLRSC